MTIDVSAALREWREADKHARSVELLLAEAWRVYESGGGPIVSQALMQDVSQARAVASNKLTVAMLLISEQARK